MSEEFNIVNHLAHISFQDADGMKEGNGFITGRYLITAGHVIDDLIEFNVYFGNGKKTVFKRSDAVHCVADEPSISNWTWNDCALIPLKRNRMVAPIMNPIILEKNSKAYCLSFVDGANGLELIRREATIADTRGNFIACFMDKPMGEGQSGSPLIQNDRVIGFLVGGENGNPCLFQSVASLAPMMLSLFRR